MVFYDENMYNTTYGNYTIVYIMMMVIFMFLADTRIAIIGSIAILLSAIVSYIFINQIAKANKSIYNKRDEANRKYSEMYNKNKLTYLFSLQRKIKHQYIKH